MNIFFNTSLQAPLS